MMVYLFYCRFRNLFLSGVIAATKWCTIWQRIGYDLLTVKPKRYKDPEVWAPSQADNESCDPDIGFPLNVCDTLALRNVP